MSTRIAVVDSAVANYQTIISSLDPSISVIVIDSTTDGWSQLASQLAGWSDISAIDIFSHGADASVRLGNVTLDGANLSAYSQVLADIGSHLAPGGDVLLYGCNVAQDGNGQAFIDQLGKPSSINSLV